MTWRKNPGIIPIGYGVLWLVVQVGLLFFGPRNSFPTSHFIIRHGYDAERYLAAAQSILAGNMPIGPAQGFIGYDLFVTFFIWSGLGQIGIVLAQSLLTSLAAYCLYRLARRIFDNRAGLTAALFYVVYVELHYWNFYIQSESLFVSMIIISLFLVVEWRGWLRMSVAGLVVLFTSVIRPNGIILILSVGIYVSYSLLRARRYKALVGVACATVVAFPLAINFVSVILAHFHRVGRFSDGIIIAHYGKSYLAMPGVLPAGLQEIQNPLFKLLFFITQKPLYFLKLAGRRLWYLFVNMRPYYSAFHKYYLLMVLVPSYALAAGGVLSRSEHTAEKLFLLSLCCLQGLVVALTYVDNDGRYSLVLMPIVFVFAGGGARIIFEAGQALVKSKSR
jgi:hypothetical protein